MNSVALFAVLVACSLAIVCGQNCDQVLARADGCFKKILFLGDPEQVTPASDREMLQHCKLMRTSYPCFRQYTTCLRLFPKQIFSLLAINTGKLINNKCGTTKARNEFMKQMSCMTRENKPRADTIVQRFANLVEYISVNVTRDDRFPWACCAYHYTVDKMTTELERSCVPINGPDSVKYMNGMVTGLVAEAMELGCGKFSSLQQCHRLSPRAMRAINRLSSKPSEKTASVLTPLMRIALSLIEE